MRFFSKILPLLFPILPVSLVFGVENDNPDANLSLARQALKVGCLREYVNVCVELEKEGEIAPDKREKLTNRKDKLETELGSRIQQRENETMELLLATVKGQGRDFLEKLLYHCQLLLTDFSDTDIDKLRNGACS